MTTLEVSAMLNISKHPANPVPQDVPMYFFISKEHEEAVPGWKQAINDYIAKIVTGKTMELDTGHYLHYHQSEIVEAEAKAFLQEADRR